MKDEPQGQVELIALKMLVARKKETENKQETSQLFRLTGGLAGNKVMCHIGIVYGLYTFYPY